MKVTIEIPWGSTDDIINEIGQIENVSEAKEIDRKDIKGNILERKPNNQIEIIEVIISIIISTATKETYEFTKKKILDHLNKKKVKIKKTEDEKE